MKPSMLARFGVFVCLLAAVLVRVHADTLPFHQELPFRFSDGLIRVEARALNFAEPLTFVLDSGASVSVLNLATAQKLGLEKGKEVRVKGVSAMTAGYWAHVAVKAGQILLPQDYLAVDLNELSGKCQTRVDGLIGADFFRGQVVQIDFAAQKLRILSPSSRPARSQQEPSGSSRHIGINVQRAAAATSGASQEIVPLKLARSGALLLSARINNGQKQWLRFD